MTAKPSTTRRTQPERNRHFAVTSDAHELRRLLVQLVAALRPGHVPREQTEKLGKPGKRPYGTVNVNTDASDLLTLIDVGVYDAVDRARLVLGDEHRRPDRATWRLLYARAWQSEPTRSGLLAARANRTRRATDNGLRSLPGLVDRLHGLEDPRAAKLARSIAGELEKWRRQATDACGLGRPTMTFADACPQLDGLRPCGRLVVDLERGSKARPRFKWLPGRLIGYKDVDRKIRVITDADHDVWCDTCGTRWPAAQFAELGVALLKARGEEGKKLPSA